MSDFIGDALPQNILTRGDQRLNREFINFFDFAECNSARAPSSFRTSWWPSRQAFSGDFGADVGVLEGYAWTFFDPAAGSSSSYAFTGVTRDVYNSPLAEVTVKLFLTSNDTLVAQTVSDPSGNYTLVTPYYPAPHYLVTYKTGTPDVFGSSPNTLIGA